MREICFGGEFGFKLGVRGGEFVLECGDLGLEVGYLAG